VRGPGPSSAQRDQPPAAGTTGRLLDGTPYFARLGELVPDADETHVQCHLCGYFWRTLGTHLRLSHGWSTERYREAFGLSRTRALQAPELSGRQATRWRRMMGSDARIKKGMAEGAAKARSGELPRLALAEHRRDVRPLERRRTDRSTGSALGSTRARRLWDEREARARALGYASLDAYLRARYQDEGKPVGLLAAELGVAETTVTADMDRVGIPRRPQSERLAAGRAALHAGRKRRREALLARARELGFDSLAAYLTERHHERGWRRADIAAELGLSPTPFTLTRLMDAEGVAGNPRAGPRADAPRE